jgi:phytoene synthase
VRRHDPDRFLATLFAPPERRETLFLLYAFNHELARAREAASSPTLALIRLQWWREVVEGADRRHDVAAPLREAIAAGRLDRAALLGLIEGREAEAEAEIPTLAAWEAYLTATAGDVMAIAGIVLGATAAAAAALRTVGAAYGAAGLLRSVSAHARQNRCLLPADILAAHHLAPDNVVADPQSAKLDPVRRRLSQEARDWLHRARRLQLPRSAVAAALPGVLARRDLRHPTEKPRGLGDRIAVIAAGLTGRLGLS